VTRGLEDLIEALRAAGYDVGPTARVRLAVVLSHADVGEADLGPVLCALLGRKPEDADAIVRVVTDWRHRRAQRAAVEEEVAPPPAWEALVAPSVPVTTAPPSARPERGGWRWLAGAIAVAAVVLVVGWWWSRLQPPPEPTEPELVEPVVGTPAPEPAATPAPRPTTLSTEVAVATRGPLGAQREAWRLGLGAALLASALALAALLGRRAPPASRGSRRQRPPCGCSTSVSAYA
jgi:hypothetical protein